LHPIVPPDTHLRIASPDDAASVVAIYMPYVRDTAVSFELQSPTTDEMRVRIESVLEHHLWLLACRGAHVTGYAYASPHASRAAYRWSVDVAVYLEPTAHRRGIARRLYAALLGLLAQQGYVNAYAGITLPNPASVGFHEALGFSPVGVYHQVGFKHGAWRNVGWWSRCLRDCPEAPTEPRSVWELDAEYVTKLLAASAD
jgi:phosphinothricin acetyltransferase